MSLRFLVPFFILLAAVGCDTLHVGSDFDHEAVFSYRSYAWVPRTEYGDIPAPVVEATRESIRNALRARGFTELAAPESADFTVDFTIGSRMRMEIETYPPPYQGRWWNLEDWWGHPYWGYALDVRQYREGTLSVDVFDRRSARPVWHGWASKELTRTDLEHPAHPIRTAVAAILRDFPPQ